jgi:hypothetical protein
MRKRGDVARSACCLLLTGFLLALLLETLEVTFLAKHWSTFSEL